MNVIQIGINSISSTILQIGFEGENEHTSVVFYWTPIYLNYPDAVATMKIKSPAGVIYPKTVTQSGNKITWDVTASDCAAFGNGQYQLTFTDGEEVIKTYIGNFNVMASIVGEGTPPDPIEDWMEEASETLAALKAFEDVTVTGATPNIVGEENKRYICGEVSTITISAPQTGMIDVVFISGSTPATLTTTGITFPVWFDGTLNANTRYEVNVLDGYGVVTTWQTT